MKGMRKITIGLMTLPLLVGAGLVKDAAGEIRARATINTPNAQVRISTHPYAGHRGYKKMKRTHRVYRIHAVTKHDRKVAGRLANYTGVPTRELIQLRRQGYRWNEIGRWLYLPRPVVRAAMHHRTWKRFLRDDHMIGRFWRVPYRERGIAFFEYEYNDD